MSCMTSAFLVMTCKSMTYVIRVCAIEVHNRLTVHNIEGLLAECLCLMSIGRMMAECLNVDGVRVCQECERI